MEIVTHLAAAVFGAALLQVYFVWRDTRSARLPSVRSRELPPATSAQLSRAARANRADLSRVRRGTVHVPPPVDDFEPPEAA